MTLNLSIYREHRHDGACMAAGKQRTDPASQPLPASLLNTERDRAGNPPS
jgi:hypothetical protein